jgi:hypothetical protein
VVFVNVALKKCRRRVFVACDGTVLANETVFRRAGVAPILE